MAQLSLEQQIGQLFVIGFTGQTAPTDSQIVRDIGEGCLGGVILFDRHLASNSTSNNIVSREQLRGLTENLQKQAEIPLLIAVDQEGGRVSRFKEERGFPVTPTARELGKEKDIAKTRRSGRQTAEMLRDVGVNFNMAPVVDLDIYSDNPIIGRYGRSFSHKAATVIAHARVWIEEQRKLGILSCLKHFPGHGSSVADSHLGFVDISKSWQKKELLPYKTLIDDGLADTVMVGHLFHQGLDATYPATLSSPILNTLLRQELKFEGVVVSDDMQMKAITEHYGFAEACCRAVAAGVDLLVIGNNLLYDPDILSKGRKALLQGIKNGVVTEQRISQAWSRIHNLKHHLYP